ncbi:hypothetical protein XELAEV_18047912mg [Xenopus laevis]|uniref:Taste receptor type 2 n=1 Tax=Xenopus laevis TaxID=8355 RepID=A0A974BW27_XENLA|nr:hypothetical protein XELAEV_18047912mg [Xenopus laevis]
MAFSINVIKITSLIVTWLCGSMLNSSIVAVYLRDWKNRIILGECERTILTIGCTNLFMQCFLTISETIVVYELYGLFFKEIYVVGSILFFSLTYVSMWLTACLSICYYMKLLNISLSMIVRSQRGLSSTLFLFGSVMVSCLINVLLIWTIDTELLQNTTLSAENSIYKLDIKFMLFNVVIGCCVPVLITSLCIGLSVMFLLRHVQKMKNNTFQLKSHVGACRTMSFLLILNLIFFLTVITVPWPWV